MGVAGDKHVGGLVRVLPKYFCHKTIKLSNWAIPHREKVWNIGDRARYDVGGCRKGAPVAMYYCIRFESL